MRAIGLDLGTKTLGIAITDSNKIIANGLENYHYPNFDLSFCIQKIETVFLQYKNDIDTIVLGYPKYKSGQKSGQTLFVEKFYQLLKQKYSNLQIVLEDEKYSTIFATNRLKELGFKSSKIKKIKDTTSAIIILESWLQQNK